MKRSILTISLAAALGLALVATDAFAQRRGGGGGGGGMRAGGGGFGGGGMRAGGGGYGGMRAGGGGFRTGGGGFRAGGGGYRGAVVGGGYRGAVVGGGGRYGYRGGSWGGRHYGGGWRRPYWGVGAGLAAGAIIGSTYPYYYDDYDAPVVTYGYSEPVYEDSDGGESSVAACAQRFRSYNPATGTYRGYDGLDHPCP